MTTPAPPEYTDALGDLASEYVALRERINTLEAEAAALLAEGMELALAEMAAQTGISSERELPLRAAVAEFAAAARVPHRTMEELAWDAHGLVQRFPQTYAALAEGKVSVQHVRAVTATGIPVDADPVRVAEYEEKVLAWARCETAARVRPYARALATRLFPRDIAADHARAMSVRAVRLVDLNDGMSDLVCTMPSVLAHAVYDRVTQIGHEIKAVQASAGRGKADSSGVVDARTHDQIRADVVADMLLTGVPTAAEFPGIAAIRAQVQVTIPASALAGAHDRGAELGGYGPVDPALIRQLAGVAPAWERLFLDPVRETITVTDRYRPTDSMRRRLRARDARCRFPGCRRPAPRTDLDHTEEYARGGVTSLGNLASLCRGHHTLKHPDLPDKYRWKAKQRSDGVIEWTSPTGKTYTDFPPPRVVFDDPVPPWAVAASTR